MNPQGLADELNELLATESRSLARHLDEATPYLTAGNYRLWRQIQHLGAQSAEHTARLTALIDALDLPPRPRPYSADVARFHFLGLDYLLPRLIEEKQRQIRTYQRALEHAGREERALSALQTLLKENQHQLQQLVEIEKQAAAACGLAQ